MAFTYGFYNSQNGDRKYDATDISRMFDGIITDGVIASVGDAFAVKAAGGKVITVGTGRAWFDHTWSYNDSAMRFTLQDASSLQDRYVAVVLRINFASSMRSNVISLHYGSASTNPKKPTPTKTNDSHEYALAYILQKAGSTEVTQSDIEYVVGTDECPICTGVMTSLSFDNVIAQWDAEHTEWMADQKSEQEEYISNRDSEFTSWFNGVKDTLSTDAAGKLNTRIDGLATISMNLKSTSWTGSGPYRQRVSISGMTSSRNFGPMFVVPTGNQETDAANAEALGCLSYGVTGSGYVDIYCYDQKPDITFTVYASGRI